MAKSNRLMAERNRHHSEKPECDEEQRPFPCSSRRLEMALLQFGYSSLPEHLLHLPVLLLLLRQEAAAQGRLHS
jgi:hypothetical protein